MARAMGATLTGSQKLLGEIKIFIFRFFNLYFAPHAFINCIAAASLLTQGIKSVVLR